jgi:hypothetical protein
MSINTAALVLAGLLVVALGEAQARPASPLTAGLRGPWTDTTKEFDVRVRRQFPVGTSEDVLSQALTRQGFRQEDWGGVTGTEHEAVRREDNIACNIAARIFWRADKDRRIQSIRGTYREEGCL